MFYATKGGGSFLKTGQINGDPVPIHVSKTTTIPNADISMDPGYGRDSDAVGKYCAIQSAILSKSVRTLELLDVLVLTWRGLLVVG